MNLKVSHGIEAAAKKGTLNGLYSLAFIPRAGNPLRPYRLTIAGLAEMIRVSTNSELQNEALIKATLYYLSRNPNLSEPDAVQVVGEEAIKLGRDLYSAIIQNPLVVAMDTYIPGLNPDNYVSGYFRELGYNASTFVAVQGDILEMRIAAYKLRSLTEASIIAGEIINNLPSFD